MQEIFGHNLQRANLKKLFESNKIPSAMLFSGDAGIGKKLVAYEVARSFLCDSNTATDKKIYGGCGKCRSCELLLKSNLADLISINCAEKEEINVEKTRELLYSLNLKSFTAGSRIIILDNVENISVVVANILLKSIEEPRANNYFILVSSNPYKLPATLLSRCQIWYFDALKFDDIKRIINSGSNHDEYSELSKEVGEEELTQIADGSIENLQNCKDFYEEWCEIKAAIPKMISGDGMTAIELANSLSKDKESLRIKIKLLRNLLRQTLKKDPGSVHSAKIGLCITNLILSENLIFDRNITASYLLNNILLELAESYSSSNQQITFNSLLA